MSDWSPFISDFDFTLYVGDALQVLQGLPAESVHCCVTSPPYWGLRDYGTGTWDGGDPDHEHDTVGARGGRGGSGTLDKRSAEAMPDTVAADICSCGATRVDQQLGLESTPDEYVANMVAVFREVKRVLRRDGSLWLNLGDSYVSGQGGRQSAVGELPPSIRQDRPTPKARPELENAPSGWAERAVTPRTYPGRDSGLKPKDLYGMPWRVAFALQADGWYLRSDIIWSKPNPMPESVTDRPTKAHEYLFLLTKSPRYFYDADAIREPAEWARWGDQTNGKHEGSESAAGWIGSKSKDQLQGGRQARRYSAEEFKTTEERNTRFQGPNPTDGGRNKRSVWEIATAPYPDAHFATFPPALVEPCVKAGTSEHGCCPECGAPWEREVERQPLVLKEPAVPITERRGDDVNDKRTALSGTQLIAASSKTIGWHPSCEHIFKAEPCVVLDPFMGSGTTAQVARRLGRHSIGIELNPEYAELCAKRLQQQSLFA